MYISIYNATSIDGFIAKPNDDTEWVSPVDWDIFSSKVKESKVIVMGRRTFEVSGEDFPYDCELNVVLTHDQELIAAHAGKPGILFTALDPAALVKELSARGYQKLLVIGGGHTNTEFLKMHLVNEVIVDVHPLILGEGVPLFAGKQFEQQLELKDIKPQKEGLVQLIYKVV